MSRRGSGDGPTGLCIVDKPSGWTSHDVVARTRRLLGTRRVGHAGTLDPMATGVLVLGVGRATRLLRFITGVDKTYDATIRFGVETDSLDADGEVTVVHEMEPPDPSAVLAGAAQLTGDIEQVPPMVSALHVDGWRLHELAREGIEVERAPRPVTVHRFDPEPTEDPMVWTATIHCSSGTYVRSLAAELGHALGGGAHLIALRRTSVGPFGLDEARPLDEPEVLPAAEAVRHLERVAISPATVADVLHGKVLDREVLEVHGEGPWAVLDDHGVLLAVYESHGERVKPAMVLASGDPR